MDVTSNLAAWKWGCMPDHSLWVKERAGEKGLYTAQAAKVPRPVAKFVARPALALPNTQYMFLMMPSTTPL